MCCRRTVELDLSILDHSCALILSDRATLPNVVHFPIGTRFHLSWDDQKLPYTIGSIDVRSSRIFHDNVTTSCTNVKLAVFNPSATVRSGPCKMRVVKADDRDYELDVSSILENKSLENLNRLFQHFTQPNTVATITAKLAKDWSDLMICIETLTCTITLSFSHATS